MLWTWKGENVNIHVGNLAREVTEAELRQAFGEFGNVAAVRIVTDRHSGVSRGFGFVDMPDRDEAQAAIQGLNMKELAGRTLDLSEARGLRDGRRDSRNTGNTGRGRPANGRKRGGSGGARRRF
jgi:RNA recognition motif-containing protein